MVGGIKMKRNTFVRIMCIFLAVLMLGSVVLVAIQAFAYGPDAAAVVATGDNNNKHTVIIIAVIAVAVLLGAVFAPTIIKKLKK